MRLPVLGASVVLLCGLCGIARADETLERPEIRLTQPELPDGRSYSQRIKENLSNMSLDLNQHLDKLSGSMFNMKFNVSERTGKLHLGGGDTAFGLRIDSDIKFERGYATFNTTLDLAVGGETFKLQLPEFDMVPRSLEGERFVELRLPLIKGTF